ncbi:MAG: pseudouridine synthase RluD [Actinomycetota bacterium]
MIHEEIPPALDGERLDRVVSLLADVTRTVAAQLVADGHVSLDGEPSVIGKLRLRAGQSIEIDETAIALAPLPQAEPSVPCNIVYDDSDVIVVNKPVGQVVHPGAGNPNGTLVNGLLARYPEIASVGEAARPGIVHRLDIGTSGLLVVARTARAYEVLVDALSHRDVVREYLTLVWGQPESSNGVIDAPIGRDPRDPLKMAVVAGGRASRTRFEVVERFGRPKVSLLRCRLETGRTHQIRVHLEGAGFPVVGDATYGGARSQIRLARPFLHAAHLEFDHPVTGQHLGFDAPLPDDLQRIIEGLHSGEIS